MCEQNGIMYADNPAPVLTIKQVCPLDNYKLHVRFSTDEEKVIDISHLLNEPVFRPLHNLNLFKSVYIDYGTVVWCDGTIDIAPEYLYNMGVPAKVSKTAKTEPVAV